jgi:hypothetical protein
LAGFCQQAMQLGRIGGKINRRCPAVLCRLDAQIKWFCDFQWRRDG